MPGVHAGRVAIVTSANHGIGAATAVALAAGGASVLITYLRLEDAPDQGIPDRYRQNRARDACDVLSAVEAAGGRAVAVEADLSDPAVPATLFERAEAELGPVDILVNNASGWLTDSFHAGRTDRYGRALAPVSAMTFDQLFMIDARGGALMIAEFAWRLIQRGGDWGRIVSLTSGSGKGFPEEVSYGAAKAALAEYTFSAAAELAGFGVTANIVHPPVTDTGWVSDEIRAALRDKGRPDRVARPEDVARVIAFLTSDDAALVSGNLLRLS